VHVLTGETDTLVVCGMGGEAILHSQYSMSYDQYPLFIYIFVLLDHNRQRCRRPKEVEADGPNAYAVSLRATVINVTIETDPWGIPLF
jgi:hypothetical protein